MDEEKIREIIFDFSAFYNLGNLYPLEIRDLLEDRCDDALVIEIIFDYIKERNSRPSTFCYGINGAEKEGIFKKINNSRREV